MEFYTLQNANGLKLKVSSYGGLVTEIHTPDRDGHFADIALGFDTIEEYGEKKSPYFGALIGRFGNRIGQGKFTLDGKECSFAINNGENHLHGGLVGFDKVKWNAEEISGEGFTGLKLRYLSKHMEEGYPGNLDVTVIYMLTDENEWIIEYEATTDEPTVCNLTQHTYFNLLGHDGGDVLGHEIQLNADLITPVSDALIPTGEVRPVAGTPFDFAAFKPMGQDIGSDDEQIVFANGYDHNFVIRKPEDGAAQVALVREPKSGRTLEVTSTEPGVQFYTGNFLDGSQVGKGGAVYETRSGFCLETQHFPDSPNHGHFPSTRLDPGQLYKSTTIYKFGAH